MRPGVLIKDTKLVFDMAHQPGLTEPHATSPTDYSRYGHTITFQGDGEPDWEQLTSGLWVMNFDGTNDRITIPNHSVLNGTDIFLEMWVLMTTDDPTSTYYEMVTKAYGNDVYPYYLDYDRTTDTVIFGFWDGTYHVAKGPSDIRDGAWHHVLGGIYGNISTVFIDGVSGTPVDHGHVLPSNTSALYVGHNIRGFERYKGRMGLPRIHTRNFSEAQASARYTAERAWLGV